MKTPEYENRIKTIMRKLIYKYFICENRGHLFAKIQEKTWHDFYKQVCKNCSYTDNVQYPSPIKIDPKMDGTFEITLYTGSTGSLGGGSGGSGSISNIYNGENDYGPRGSACTSNSQGTYVASIGNGGCGSGSGVGGGSIGSNNILSKEDYIVSPDFVDRVEIESH